jgi:single-stranded DNA-binding protein
LTDALISGRLYGKPVARTSKTGRSLVTGKIRAAIRDGETVFVSLIAFAPPAVAALVALSDGDSAALVGELTPKVYTPPTGEPRPALDLLAQSVLSPYHVQHKRRAVSGSAASDLLETLPEAPLAAPQRGLPSGGHPRTDLQPAAPPSARGPEPQAASHSTSEELEDELPPF